MAILGFFAGEYLLTFFLTLTHVSLIQAANLPSEITYQVTYRGFLPSNCFVNGYADITDFKEAWKYNDTVDNPDKIYHIAASKTLNPNIQDTTGCTQTLGYISNTQARNKYRQLFAEGIIKPHPDFQTGGNSLVQINSNAICRGPSTAENFPILSCVGSYPDDVSIIKLRLKTGESGLPKPEYCLDDENSRCGYIYKNLGGAKAYAQSTKKYFDLWFSDDLQYNRRIGLNLKLTLRNGQYVYNSNGDNEDDYYNSDQTSNFFAPFRRYNDPNTPYHVSINNFNAKTSPAWPKHYYANQGQTNKNSLWITTELHTTFKYDKSANMVFKFSGDDDFWTFIDGQMVMDIGGVHPRIQATLELEKEYTKKNYYNQTETKQTAAELLGLQDGKVYTLDIFHAERQSTQSNFFMTTELFPACNVEQSGTIAFDSTAKSTQYIRDNFELSNQVTLNGANIKISSASEKHTSYFAYTKNSQNLGRGFISEFKVNVNEETDGFAFVIQNQGITNYPFTGYPNFNFGLLPNSFAVVFDLCMNRNHTSCDGQEVRLHYPESSDIRNNASSQTRKVYDKIARPIAGRGEEIEIKVVYYGGEPDFLEVFIDKSLYIRQSNFNFTDTIGTLGAFVGITATTSIISGDIVVSDWTLRTVEIDPTKTVLLSSNGVEQNVIADGVSKSYGYTIQTKDGCDNDIDSGTYGDLAKGLFVEQQVNGSYMNGSSVPAIIDAIVDDNGNGTYTFRLQTSLITQFSLIWTFGADCYFTVSNGEVTTNGANCANPEILNATISMPVPIEKERPDDNVGKTEDNSELVVIAASSGAVLFTGLLIATIFFVKYRRRWLWERKYVADGQKYILDTETAFDRGDEFSVMAGRVVNTNQEIMRLQNQGVNDPEKAQIIQLMQENREHKEKIRMKKKHMEVNDRTPAPQRPRKKRNKQKVDWDATL